MNELEAKCYLTKKGGANTSDHTCTHVIKWHELNISMFLRLVADFIRIVK